MDIALWSGTGHSGHKSGHTNGHMGLNQFLDWSRIGDLQSLAEWT